MFPELLRHHLTARRVLAATAVLIGALLLLPWTPTYAPLREAMTQRHLEARGRTPQQVAQREAARRQAAEEEEANRRRITEEEANRRRMAERAAEQQRQAEQRRAQEAAAALQQQAQQDELRRQDRELASLAAEFKRTAEQLSASLAIRPLALRIGDDMESLAHRARTDSGFYRTSNITPEETASARVCDDPAPASDVLDRNQRRQRNLFACAVYVSTRPLREPPGMAERVGTVALLQRINRPDAVRLYSLPAVLAYDWLGLLRWQLHHPHAGSPLPPFPALTEGDSLNWRLFEGMLSPGFARRLIDTATAEEKLALRDRVYPDLRRLHELGTRILPACRALQRANCLEAG